MDGECRYGVLRPCAVGGSLGLRSTWRQDRYLVDSASSHMLVSKIKPHKFTAGVALGSFIANRSPWRYV